MIFDHKNKKFWKKIKKKICFVIWRSLRHMTSYDVIWRQIASFTTSGCLHSIFFAFCTARGPLSLKICLEKNNRFGHLYKKFLSGKIDYWCFRANIGPKTIIFGLHVKFPKKNYFFNKYSWTKLKKRFFFIFGHIYEDK